MWREFNLINSFTLECSFCGPTKGIYSGCHFNTQILDMMGRVFSKTLMDYVDNEQKVKRIYSEIQIRFPSGMGAGNPKTEDGNKDHEYKGNE